MSSRGIYWSGIPVCKTEALSFSSSQEQRGMSDVMLRKWVV